MPEPTHRTRPQGTATKRVGAAVRVLSSIARFRVKATTAPLSGHHCPTESANDESIKENNVETPVKVFGRIQRSYLNRKPTSQPMDELRQAIKRVAELASIPPAGRAAFEARVQEEINRANVPVSVVPPYVPKIGILPSGMTWPTETYSEARQDRGENIVQFLERVWQPLIEAGAVDLRTLRAKDAPAATAVNNFTKGGRRHLPDHLHLPTIKEVNDRLAAATADHPGDRPARLDWALRRRATRHITCS